MEMVYVKGQHFISKELREATNRIMLAGENIRKNYLKIAHELSEIDSRESYLADNYESTIDYAMKVFNMKKSTAYNLIEIGRNWIRSDGSRTLLTNEGSDYTISQVGVMLPAGIEVADHLHKMGEINTSMSVRELKSIIKKNLDLEEPEAETVSESEEEATGEDLYSYQITFYESGEISYSGSLPEWFTDEIESLFSKLLSGETA